MDAERARALADLAERCRPLLLGLDASRVLEDLGAHATELDATLSWLLEHGRPDSALRVASALTPFWIATGRLSDGAQWSDRTANAARDGRARGLGA